MYSASNSVFISHLWFAIAPLLEEFQNSGLTLRGADPLLWCSFAQRNGRNATKLFACGEMTFFGKSFT